MTLFTEKLNVAHHERQVRMRGPWFDVVLMLVGYHDSLGFPTSLAVAAPASALCPCGVSVASGLEDFVCGVSLWVAGFD